MLPSTGYFKELKCPLYDGGTCERPYCHFKHLKKEPDIVSTPSENMQFALQAAEMVLQDTDDEPSQEKIESLATRSLTDIMPLLAKPGIPTYNPTPIAKLKQIKEGSANTQTRLKHIPIPYTPHRPSIQLVNRRQTEQALSRSKLEYQPSGSSGNDSVSYVPSAISTLPKTQPDRNHDQNIIVNLQDLNDSLQKPDQFSDQEPESVPGPNLHLYPEQHDFISSENSDIYGLEGVSNCSNITKLEKAEFDELENLSLQIEEIVRDYSSDMYVDSEKPKTDVLVKKLTDNNKHKSKHSKSKHNSNKERHQSKSSSKSKSEHTNSSKRKSENDISRKKDSEKSKSKDSHKSDRKEREKSKKKSTEKSSSSSKRESTTHRNDKNKSSNKSDKRKSKEQNKIDKHKKHDKSKSRTDSKKVIPEQIQDILESSSDSDDIESQCLEIFYNSELPKTLNPVEEPKPSTSTQDSSTEQDTNWTLISKKRVARLPTTNVPQKTYKPSIKAKPNFIAKSSQAMVDRYRKVYEEKALQDVEKRVEALVSPSVSSVSSTTTAQYPTNPTGRVRIAHVPNVSSLLTSKSKVEELKTKVTSTVPKTIPQTIPKGQPRVAHTPQEELVNRPMVLQSDNPLIPVHIRLVYLNDMIDACMELYPIVGAAFTRGQNEEFATFSKCKSLNVYRKSASLAIHRLKNEAKRLTQSQSAGNSHGRRLYPVVPTGVDFYNYLTRWVLSEEDLQANGFPRKDPAKLEKGAAKVYTRPQQYASPSEFERICCRCRKIYAVDQMGFAVNPEECIYHPNRRYTFRGESKYACCKGDSSAVGCASGVAHVSDYVDYDNLHGFVQTLPPDESRFQDGDYGVFSLDCEMTYTISGLELSRVTVIDRNCKVTYDQLVRPDHPIIDYNTRFSGLTENHLKNVTTTLRDVQATLLHLFNNKTILIGHSLESDLKVLKIIHSCVIDTSVLFPHKMGPPLKRSLKNLASEHLKKIIQDNVAGHDSTEDAVCCMELVMWKLKEDLKT